MAESQNWVIIPTRQFKREHPLQTEEIHGAACWQTHVQGYSSPDRGLDSNNDSVPIHL